MGTKKLPLCFLPLTSIDVIAGQVGFSIDGPGQVHLGWTVWIRGDARGYQALRDGGRVDVTRSDNGGNGVGGLDRAAISSNYRTHCVDVGFGEVERGVSVACSGRGAENVER